LQKEKSGGTQIYIALQQNSAIILSSTFCLSARPVFPGAARTPPTGEAL
jgi:hypothetical protein